MDEALSHSILDESNPASRELQRAHIGDPAQSRQLLDKVSPLKHAADVQVPLLIAHGDEGTRVLPSQSRDMVKALQALGNPVEWKLFEGEGHGLNRSNDRIRYYQAVLDFLQRAIGEPQGYDPSRGG